MADAPAPPPDPPQDSAYVSLSSLGFPAPPDEPEVGEEGGGSTLLSGIKRLFGAGGGGQKDKDSTAYASSSTAASSVHLDPHLAQQPPPSTRSSASSSKPIPAPVPLPPSDSTPGTEPPPARADRIPPGGAKAALAANLGRTTSSSTVVTSSRQRSASQARSRATSTSRITISRARSSSPPSHSHAPPAPAPSSTSHPSHPSSPHAHLPLSPSHSHQHQHQRFVRPLRLSQTTPSLALVSLQNAETPLNSSVPPSASMGAGAWPARGTAGWAHGIGGGGGGEGESPTFPSSSSTFPDEGEPAPSSSSIFGASSGPRRIRRLSLVSASPLSGLQNLSLGSLALRRTTTWDADDTRSVLSLSTSVGGGAGGGGKGGKGRESPKPSAEGALRGVRSTGMAKNLWMGDETTKECSTCQKKFSIFNRRHHCRLCGHIFCASCTPHFVPGTGRVCLSCFSSRSARLANLPARDHPHRTSFDNGDAVSLSRSYRGHGPGSGGSPYHGAAVGGFPHPPSRPSSLYQSRSYLVSGAGRRPVTPLAGRPEDDRISERSSRPASSNVDGEEGGKDEEKQEDGKKKLDVPSGGGKPKSPKSSLRKDAKSEAGRSEGKGEARAGGGARPEEVHSPALSAVPFRKDAGEEDEHDSHFGGDDEEHEGEGEKEGNGLGISVKVTTGEEGAKGLGLDLGEGVELDTTPTPRPPPPSSSSAALSALTTPASAAPESFPFPASSNLLPDLPPPRHSPSVPHFDRSTSRLSLLGPGTSGLTLFPWDVPQVEASEPPEVAHKIPISRTALEHIRRMLRQSLEREGVPHPKAWAKELERLLLQIADRLSALPYRAVGDDLDVKEYVRVKRIPGGRPRDSEFVSGVVITKNLMHKSMPRAMTNPKVMLLSRVPLDFHRDNQFYTLETVVAQADQAVDKLVGRIHQFFPDLLLVEDSVSQHALKLLREKVIAAARHVKHSALEAVARALGADIVTSVSDLADRALPLDANHRPLRIVSRCQTFRVQTFVHKLIPGGRKTILRFEGEDAHKPCTVILRGEDFETLAKLKRILHMLVLVVYNAKLEGYLLHDQRFELLTPSVPLPSLFTSPPSSTKVSALPDAFEAPPSLPSAAATSQQISQSIEPYTTAALSGSALVHYPPPYPLARMAEEDRKIREMRDAREKEETQRIIDEEAASRAQSVSGGSSSASLHELDSHPASPQEAPSSFSTAGSSLLLDAALLARRQSRDVIQHPAELVKQTAFVEAEERHKQHLVAWDAYRQSNADSFDPVDYQQLFVLESLLVFSGKTGEPNRLCRPPTVRAFTFYGENDRTIGAFLREADVAQRTSEPCPSPSCHEPLARHQRVYVHDGFVVKISSEAYNNDAIRGQIGMSSECKRDGCACDGRLGFVSNETTRISFAKFLELSFYPSEHLLCADPACGHDGQLDHVRYWHFGSVRVEIRMDKIDLRDVVAPPRHIKVRPDQQLALRNAEFEQCRSRSEAFFNSVQARILAFKFDCVPVDRIEECKAALFEFSTRCENDRKAIARLLKSAYEHAGNSNGTEMTVVRRALQEKSHLFDAEWATFAKKIMPAEAADMRRVSTTQLKRLFPEAAGLAVSPGRRSASSNLPPALEIDEMSETSSDATPLSPSSDSSSLVLPQDSTAEDGDASSVLSAEVQIEPPTLHIAEVSTDSTSTVLPTDPDVSPYPSIGLAASPPSEDSPSFFPPVPAASIPPPARSPRISRSPTFPRPTIEESDLDSDSTVCADGEPGGVTATHPARTNSPFIRRHLPPTRLDETSAAESEADQSKQSIWQRRKGHHVASLVDAFESTSSLGRSPSGKKKPGSPSRPGMRRAHTDKPSSLKVRPPKPAPFSSDNDSSYARNVGVSHLMDPQLTAAAARPSRIPARKQIKANTLSSIFHPLDPLDTTTSPPGDEQVTSLGLSLSPNSSRPPSRAPSRPPSRGSSRPISPTATRSSRLPVPDGSAAERSSSRPPLKTLGSSRSTIKGKTSRLMAAQSESSDGGRALQPTVARGSNLSRPTASSANKVTSRRVVSTGAGRHVSNMRRHWDSLAAAAEKRNALRKRARPIITSQPTLQVFDNIRDAIKEDSDDERDEPSSGGESDGADDEFDDEIERDEEREDDEHKALNQSTLTLRRENTLRPSEPTLRPPAPQQSVSTSSMADALVRSVSVAALDPSAMLAPPSPPAPPQPRNSQDNLHLSRSVEPSDSEFPSVPPSPSMPDSFTFPRMSEGESSGAERKSIFNAFSSLWTYRNGDFSPLAYPTVATEHVYADNPVVLRDDEPTSIIAHALSSKKYYQAFDSTDLPRIREALSNNKAESIHTGDGASEISPDPELAKTIEDLLRASTQRSFKLGDVELGDISARCTVFWVEQFEALRRQCGCDTQFVESLSRCFKWDAAGGKSKVDFMKTLDDRFIVKQLSRPEMEVFARFAPAYFQYMADALFQGKPTVLAKVFGIYRISLGKHYRNVDFLVMENLFYGRQLKQIFDLKGSTRNRRADESNPVLLDENLLELSLKNPFYVREESKQFIKQAIYNDSQFLSDLNVMDYSLVVGVDAVQAELCVGIVDYIRTYTWDKRIESWVKETTFLGGASKSGGPTVITPKQYKMRFREAIDGYLLLSPTPWLNPRSLLPAFAGDGALSHACGQQPQNALAPPSQAADNASLFSARGGAATVPPTPSSSYVSSFGAAVMG
ncbi:hypothetical protein JCM8547_001605 [Rhodosporidiobolus lusitaniae]